MSKVLLSWQKWQQTTLARHGYMLIHVPGSGTIYLLAMAMTLATTLKKEQRKDDLLSSIVSKSRHKNDDGKPSYEEIISTIEQFVGLYASDARINYETGYWLEQHGVKMSQQNIERIIDDAKTRVHGREEIESIDALTIASSDKARDWLIAGIVPLGSVTLLAAAGGTGKALPLWSKILTPSGWTTMGKIKGG
jgi:hypothetical protein